MFRRSRLHYTLTTIGYWVSRIPARLPRSTCLLGDSLSFGAAVRYELPSHTTSRRNQPPRPRSLVSVRATAFRSWLPPIGPIKDFHLQSLRHARRNDKRLRSSLAAYAYRSASASLASASPGSDAVWMDGLRARRKPLLNERYARDVRGADGRPAKRRADAPTAATVHAVRALFNP